MWNVISYFEGEYKLQMFENKTFIKISDLRRCSTVLQQKASETVNKACLCVLCKLKASAWLNSYLICSMNFQNCWPNPKAEGDHENVGSIYILQSTTKWIWAKINKFKK
jgi:hypothetical protein